MKKRYLIGPRQGAVMPQGAEATVESLVARIEGASQIRKLSSGHVVVEMEDEAAQRVAEQHPDLLVEEDHPLELFPMPELPPVLPSADSVELVVQVKDQKTGEPIKDVTIFAAGAQIVYRADTGADGIAKVPVRETQLQRVIASPRRGYWSKVAGQITVVAGTPLEFQLAALPTDGAYPWGPLALGVDAIAAEFSGKGIKVALVDSGIAPHEDVSAKGGFNTLDGQDPNGWNVDDEGHGTHCAGVVAALVNDVGIRGVAPGAEIYSLKVFPGGRFSDLIEAVGWCVDNYIDVISMSLGSSAYSQQLEQAMQAAVDHGIVCVAAAGNEAGPVAYPAAFDNVIAVSAIGKVGSFPDDSGHALRVSQYVSADGHYFAASFTNYGDKVEVCAPGVAVISSVPGGYASWDGTSMACPMIAGLVALILEAYPESRTRDGWTSYVVRYVLRSSAMDLGLPAQIQGAGLPNAAYALSPAFQTKTYSQRQAEYYKSYLEDMLEQTKQAAKSLEDALADIS